MEKDELLQKMQSSGWARRDKYKYISPDGSIYTKKEIISMANKVYLVYMDKYEIFDHLESDPKHLVLSASIEALDYPEKDRVDVEYKLFVDQYTDKSYLWHIGTDELSLKIKPNQYKLTIPKAQKEMLDRSMVRGKLIFNPYEIAKYKTINELGMDLVEYNLYTPPEWRLKTTKPALHPRIEDFFKHLFNNDTEQLNYVYSWIKRSIVDRNNVALVLNGAKGIGKGVFSECIMMSLIGMDNCNYSTVNIGESPFNSVLKDKRLIIFDEYPIDRKAHNKLKKYTNKYQNIEEKGHDARALSEIYNSYIICNNKESEMYLEHDDRRFSVMDMTSNRLLDKYTESEIEDFCDAIKEDRDGMLSSFGHWLLNREYSCGGFDILKNTKYARLVLISLHEWQKAILRMCLNNPESLIVPHDELKRAVKKYNKLAILPNMDKVGDFITSFRWENELLATMDADNTMFINEYFSKEHDKDLATRIKDVAGEEIDL